MVKLTGEKKLAHRRLLRRVLGQCCHRLRRICQYVPISLLVVSRVTKVSGISSNSRGQSIFANG